MGLDAILVLNLCLAAPAAAPAGVADRDVLEGIRLVEEGEHDAAILTLDNAARRLAADPRRGRDRAYAFLYLGIAYVGKGREAAARARFRDAVQQMRDLTLSPEKFPPKVIDLFEAARDEVRRAATTPAGGTPTPAATGAAEPKKRGSRTPLLLLGAGAAAAGVAVAVAGGGADSPSANRRSETFTGTLGRQTAEGAEYRDHRVVATASGTLDARLTWPDRDVAMFMHLFEDGTQREVAVSTAVSNTEARLTAPVTNRTYLLQVRVPSGTPSQTYMVVVQYP